LTPFIASIVQLLLLSIAWKYASVSRSFGTWKEKRRGEERGEQKREEKRGEDEGERGQEKRRRR
jgi:hypothetical protein